MKDLKEEIRDALMTTGAAAVGFASVKDRGKADSECFRTWIKNRYHAGMGYLERHAPLRENIDSVLSGTRTVISMAFSYIPEEWRCKDSSMIACYAYGEDYHEVLKELVSPTIAHFSNKFGGKWRFCVDSAPVSERYWAIRSGIGKRGMNGSVIVKDCGSLCFLAEILTDLEIEPDTQSDSYCSRCGLCIRSCPTGAIMERGLIDSSKCMSYLTIEKKGEFSETEKKLIGFSGKKALFGCDICQKVCPENHGLSPTRIIKFKANPFILNLSEEEILRMTDKEFRTYLKKSPLKRAGLEGLKRNAGT